MTVRKVLSIVIGAAAALSAGMALIIFSSVGVIDDTIAHSHRIDAAFREATAFVGEWRRSTGRTDLRPVCGVGVKAAGRTLQSEGRAVLTRQLFTGGNHEVRERHGWGVLADVLARRME